MAKVPNKKSKYDEILAKAREDKALKAAIEAEEVARKASEATPQDKLNDLLAEALAVAEEVAAATKEVPAEEPASPDSPYATKAQEEAAKKVLQEVLHPGSRKAYNIWFDTQARYYYMDVVEYDGTTVLSIKTERLTLSQAVAMAKVQKIFTEKLILRKKGV